MLRGLEAVKLRKKLRVLCNYQASWKRDDGGLFLLEFLFFFVSPILWTIQYHRRGILTAQNFPPKRKDGQLGGTQTVLQYLTYHFSDTRTSRLVSSFTEKPCQPNVKEMRIYALVFDRFSVKANHNMTILRKKLVSKPFRFKHKWVFLLTSFAAVEEEDDEITKWFDEKNPLTQFSNTVLVNCIVFGPHSSASFALWVLTYEIEWHESANFD